MLCSFYLLDIERQEGRVVRPRVWMHLQRWKKLWFGFGKACEKAMLLFLCGQSLSVYAEHVKQFLWALCKQSQSWALTLPSPSNLQNETGRTLLSRDISNITFHWLSRLLLFPQIQRGKFWMKFKFDKLYEGHAFTIMTYPIWLEFEQKFLLFRVHPLINIRFSDSITDLWTTCVWTTWIHLCDCMFVCMCAHSCLTLCDRMDCSPTRLLCPWDFPGKNTGVGCHFPLQEIFTTQGSNSHLLCLLHWQADYLPLHHLGNPICLYKC